MSQYPPHTPQQAKLTSAIDLLSQMSRGMPPPTFADDDDFMAQFRLQLDNFPIFEVQAQGNKKKDRVTGLKALKAQLVSLMKKSGGATLQDLEMLVVMKARLSDGDQAQVSSLVDAAIEKNGGSTELAPVACGSGSSGSAAKADKSGKQTAKTVTSFFS